MRLGPTPLPPCVDWDLHNLHWTRIPLLPHGAAPPPHPNGVGSPLHSLVAKTPLPSFPWDWDPLHSPGVGIHLPCPCIPVEPGPSCISLELGLPLHLHGTGTPCIPLELGHPLHLHGNGTPLYPCGVGTPLFSRDPASPTPCCPPCVGWGRPPDRGGGTGGAGGKGVWGAPGLVYGYQEPDARDPNYDEAAQGDTVFATVVPELEEGELQSTVQPMVLEYFEHGDTGEVVELLRGLNLGSRKPAVPSLAVALALEGKASHRELTSRLLSDLVGRVVTPEDIACAFDKVLRDLPDLILDTPEAPQMLGQFIARAVADHALPLDFLERYKGQVDCEHARAALDRAAVLLRIKRDVNRLDNVWGVGGGQRPVKHLVKEMNLLLREYLLSGEVAEAERCLRELEVPHFHHELVYEALLMVLEGSGEAPVSMMVTLLKVLWETGLVTLDQMNRVSLLARDVGHGGHGGSAMWG
uniref:Mannosyl-oligosaccharide glucosidase n=1 Tax=Nothoprocta perdicaria TaxID=30464 RepID=A0A8C6ZVB5_NOTPE